MTTLLPCKSLVVEAQAFSTHKVATDLVECALIDSGTGAPDTLHASMMLCLIHLANDNLDTKSLTLQMKSDKQVARSISVLLSKVCNSISVKCCGFGQNEGMERLIHLRQE